MSNIVSNIGQGHRVKVPNTNVKCVKVTGVQNIGQGHQDKVLADSVHQEEGLVVEGLTVEDIWKGDVEGVKVNGARNIGQGHPVKVPAESVH